MPELVDHLDEAHRLTAPSRCVVLPGRIPESVDVDDGDGASTGLIDDACTLGDPGSVCERPELVIHERTMDVVGDLAHDGERVVASVDASQHRFRDN